MFRFLEFFQQTVERKLLRMLVSCSFQMLMKKVDALTKSIEVESKKLKREVAIREKEAAAAMKVVDDQRNILRTKSSRWYKRHPTS